MILDGAIGDVTLVNTGRFFNGPPDRPPWRWYGDYGNYERPDPEQVVRDLDWEAWLGPAPSIDFNERHFWHWRCYWPYGTGQCGDLLSHELDFVQSLLRYGIPDTCVTAGHNAYWHDDREVPDTWTASYVFEEANCTVTFEGCQNSNRKQTPELIGRSGRMIFNDIGQDAAMFEIYADEPAYELARRPQPQPTFFFAPTREHQRPSHMEDFLQCVRTREAPRCNEDEAFVEAATLLMSAESYQDRPRHRRAACGGAAGHPDHLAAGATSSLSTPGKPGLPQTSRACQRCLRSWAAMIAKSAPSRNRSRGTAGERTFTRTRSRSADSVRHWSQVRAVASTLARISVGSRLSAGGRNLLGDLCRDLGGGSISWMTRRVSQLKREGAEEKRARARAVRAAARILVSYSWALTPRCWRHSATDHRPGPGRQLICSALSVRHSSTAAWWLASSSRR
jgi:hypothetical protein